MQPLLGQTSTQESHFAMLILHHLETKSSLKDLEHHSWEQYRHDTKITKHCHKTWENIKKYKALLAKFELSTSSKLLARTMCGHTPHYVNSSPLNGVPPSPFT